MGLIVVANHSQLVAAINGFKASYHRDYFLVNGLAAAYLSSRTSATAAPLANELSRVLCDWGAGRRGAPSMLPLPVLVRNLLDPVLHGLLNDFALSPSLDIRANARFVNGVSSAAALDPFDRNLLAVLSRLSVALFSGNTNVTYPMKALLLITGFMPALDSQVRKGLGYAGFAGTNVTQLLLPVPGTTGAKKIACLPFYLAECHAKHKALLTGAATASLYPGLATDLGRLFDVLLFMQGTGAQKLLSLTPPNRSWYGLLP